MAQEFIKVCWERNSYVSCVAMYMYLFEHGWREREREGEGGRELCTSLSTFVSVLCCFRDGGGSLLGHVSKIVSILLSKLSNCPNTVTCCATHF